MPTRETNFGDALGSTLQEAGDDLMPFLLTQFNLKRQAVQDNFNRRMDLNEHKLKVSAARDRKIASDFSLTRSKIGAEREDTLHEINFPLIQQEADVKGKQLQVDAAEAQFFIDNPDALEQSLRKKPKSSKGVTSFTFGEKVEKSVRSKGASADKYNESLVTRENKRLKAETMKKVSQINSDRGMDDEEKQAALAELPIDIDQQFLPGTQEDFGHLKFRGVDTSRVIDTEFSRARQTDPDFGPESAEQGLREFGFGDFLDKQLGAPAQAPSEFRDSEIAPEVQKSYDTANAEKREDIVMKLIVDTYPELKDKNWEEEGVQVELRALFNHFMNQLEGGTQRGIERSKQKQSGAGRKPTFNELR